MRMYFNRTKLIGEIQHIEAVESFACKHLLTKVIAEMGYSPNDHTLHIWDASSNGIPMYTLQVMLNETGDVINARRIDSLEASLLKRIGVHCGS